MNEVDFWGEHLVRWSAERLEALPAEARNYLVDVGLPTDAEWNLRVANLEAIHEDLVALLFDGPVPICVSPTGSVVAAEGPERVRFVNSSVPQLGRFLVLYEGYRRSVISLGDDEAETLIASIEYQMKALDPRAMTSEAYWNVIVEQMRGNRFTTAVL